MGLRWVDGFEHYGATARMLEGVGGAAAYAQMEWELSSANPATGTYHVRLTGGAALGRDLRRPLGQSSDIAGMGYRLSLADLPNSEGGSSGGGRLYLADWRDVSNGQQTQIMLGTDGGIVAFRDNATQLGRSDPCISAGGYHHFERKSKIDNSTGYEEVRVNEVTVLNITGVDTQATANAHAAQVYIGYMSDSGGIGFGTMDVDDLFAWDDDASDTENTVVDFVGDKGCYYRVPTADTATSDFTINGGASAYEVLDEVPPNGTDYLDDTTGTARTIVQVAALPGNVSEVIAWMPVLYGRKEESGTVELRAGVVVNGDESYTPTNSPSTDYAYMEPGPKTINPDTGVAWDSSTVPDLLIERTA